MKLNLKEVFDFYFKDNFNNFEEFTEYFTKSENWSSIDKFFQKQRKSNSSHKDKQKFYWLNHQKQFFCTTSLRLSVNWTRRQFLKWYS